MFSPFTRTAVSSTATFCRRIRPVRGVWSGFGWLWVALSGLPGRSPPPIYKKPESIRPVLPASRWPPAGLVTPYTNSIPAQCLLRSGQLIQRRLPHSPTARAVLVRLPPRYHPMAGLHSPPVFTPCSGRGNMGNARSASSKQIAKSPLRPLPPVKAQFNRGRSTSAPKPATPAGGAR